jgi:hypothetical protein
MFLPRHELLARHPSARQSTRRNTLRRRYDFHLGEAFRAALEGSHDKAAGHSGRALLLSRELGADAADPARPQPELAAALSAHAPYGASTEEAIAMLTESVGYYAALAESDPAAYEVPRIDVLTQIAVAAEAAGGGPGAVGLLREVTGLYLKAPAADSEERDLSLARARFHLGRCLLAAGSEAEGLAETDAGLELAADVLGRLGLPAESARWLAAAPRYLQLAGPDWAAAAVRSMSRHSAEGRWPQAATAARAALTMSGALAGLGGDTLRDAHAAISARAEAILAQALSVARQVKPGREMRHPERSAAD